MSSYLENPLKIPPQNIMAEPKYVSHIHLCQKEHNRDSVDQQLFSVSDKNRINKSDS